MTAQLDIERVLDDFLGDGTDELSDRVLEAALRDTEHVHQRRAWRVPRRFSDMPTPVRLLAVAAVLAAAMGGAFVLGGTINRNTSPEPAPDPSPTTHDGAAIILGSSPAGGYVAERGPVFGWPAGEVRLQIPGPGGEALVGTGPNDRQILLGSIANTGNRATLSATDRCPEPGTYDWALTNENLGFELTLVEDSCADRSTFLEGAWDRVSMFQPGGPEQRYALPVDHQTVSFTIPAAFRGASGAGPDINVDVDRADHRHGIWAQTDGPNGLYVSIVENSPPYAYFNRCDDGRGRRNGPTTIDEFLAWNQRTTGAVVSEPREVTVAGRPGIVVDITVGPECRNGDAAWDWWDGLIAGMTHRQWAVELEDRRLMIVGFLHVGPPWQPLTDDQLQIAEELVSSITLE